MAERNGGITMRMTTLCYIEQDGKYLMLHRTKKKKDINKDKWIGVGGHAEELSLIHISEPTRRTPISYAVFCLKKKKHKACILYTSTSQGDEKQRE